MYRVYLYPRASVESCLKFSILLLVDLVSRKPIVGSSKSHILSLRDSKLSHFFLNHILTNLDVLRLFIL